MTNPASSGDATDSGSNESTAWPPTIDGFELIDRQPDKGGFGEIYRAAQDSMGGREVCYKILKKDYWETIYGQPNTENAIATFIDLKRQFEDEAFITHAIQSRYVPAIYFRGIHPRTIDTVDASVDLEWPYYIREWIEGTSLYSWVPSGEDSPWRGSQGHHTPRRFAQLTREQQDRLLTIFGETAQALADAHERGVAHLDLTPRNIMLTQRREVKLIDWALARRFDASADSRFDWGLSGSPDYQPPEQLRIIPPEQPYTVTMDERRANKATAPRIDLYALGGIGYLLLTGRPPRASAEIDTERRARVLREQGLSSTHHRTLHDELRQSGADDFWVTLITKCLSQKPEGRDQDATEIVHRIATHRQEQERRVARAKWVQASFILMVLLGGAVFAVVVALFRTSLAQHRSTTDNLKRELAEQQAAAATLDRDLAERQAQREKFVARIHFASAQWFIGDHPSGRSVILDTVKDVEQALQQRPDDVMLYAALAMAHYMAGQMFTQPVNVHAPAAQRLPIDESRGQIEEGITHFNRALDICRSHEKKLPAGMSFYDQKLIAYQGRAEALVLLGRCIEALTDLDQVAELENNPKPNIQQAAKYHVLCYAAAAEQAKMGWSRPPKPRVAAFATGAVGSGTVNALTLPVIVCAGRNHLPKPDHAKAIQMTETLLGSKGFAKTSYFQPATYNAAATYALASDDPDATEEERHRRKEKAVAYLTSIEKLGYFRAFWSGDKRRRELLSDNDLDPLRRRADFKELVSRVVGK